MPLPLIPLWPLPLLPGCAALAERHLTKRALNNGHIAMIVIFGALGAALLLTVVWRFVKVRREGAH
jgi:hypothetical protein